MLDVTKHFGDTTGGVRTYLLQKARYVAAHSELRLAIVAPAATASVSDIDGARCYRLAGPPVPTQPPYRFLHSSHDVARIIARERPDVIEVGSPFLVPWVVARANRAARVPLVWFYHGNVPRLISQDPGRDGALRRAGHRAAWAYVRRVSRLVRVTVVASDFVAAELEREGVRNTVTVPLGVDLELFTPGRQTRAADTRLRYGLPDGPLAIYCGRLAREKHLDVLIRAWPAVEHRTGARLAIVGDGPSAAHFRRLHGADRVLWLPYERDREALADLVAAADLYVAPGPAETFGLAALEAMASGTPVLSVNCGGVPEMVRRSDGGALYPIGDAAGLAAAAIGLFGGDLQQYGARARDYAAREHRWECVFDRLFELYRDVAAGR